MDMRMHGHQFKIGQPADHIKKASVRTDSLVENQVLVYYSGKEEKVVNILAQLQDQSHVVRSKLSDGTGI